MRKISFFVLLGILFLGSVVAADDCKAVTAHTCRTVTAHTCKAVTAHTRKDCGCRNIHDACQNLASPDRDREHLINYVRKLETKVRKLQKIVAYSRLRHLRGATPTDRSRDSGKRTRTPAMQPRDSGTRTPVILPRRSDGRKSDARNQAMWRSEIRRIIARQERERLNRIRSLTTLPDDEPVLPRQKSQQDWEWVDLRTGRTESPEPTAPRIIRPKTTRQTPDTISYLESRLELLRALRGVGRFKGVRRP